jgi:large subunit ribosomal protein L15
MQIHQLKPIHKLKKKKRVGRGGKKGTYSGKGLKGQKSRAGRKMVPIIRELFKKYPKLRGYSARRSDKSVAVVNISEINKKFKESEVVNPTTLLEKGLIRRVKGRVPKVKILGKEKLNKKITVENCQFSKTAEENVK